MHDVKWVRDHPDLFDHSMTRRGLQPIAASFLDQDEKRRRALSCLQELQAQSNACAKEIGLAKGKGLPLEELLRSADHLKQTLDAQEKETSTLTQAFFDFIASLPNLLEEEVPDGADETKNKIVRQWGPLPSFSFDPKRHEQLGESLDQMDFETAAQMSGARFVILKGDLARLEWALASFMLDTHRKDFGYVQVSPPLLVRDAALFGTGQLPKFADDQFKTTEGRWLIPTAEVSLTNMVRERILPEHLLPLRYMAFTPCFRLEAGAAGKDTRGMIRQHQFYKVELVSITRPEVSQEEHHRLTQAAEKILQRLELPYQVVLKCAGDTAATVRKTYDLEVWLPGESAYREISSCSNAWDYQARRMQARYRVASEAGSQKSPPQFVHTLNGSGIAVGRALVAVLENYQQKDGSIQIPKVLRPYMEGQDLIKKP